MLICVFVARVEYLIYVFVFGFIVFGEVFLLISCVVKFEGLYICFDVLFSFFF